MSNKRKWEKTSRVERRRWAWAKKLAAETEEPPPSGAGFHETMDYLMREHNRSMARYATTFFYADGYSFR
jgi:hypothetical protein